MSRTIEEYMTLPYTIELTPDNGGYFVKVKELKGCMSVGDTKAEALEMIEDAMRAWLEASLEDDIEIPLPESMREESYSGKVLLRIPTSLHRKLAKNAEKEGVSLNLFMNSLLAEQNSLHEIKALLAANTTKLCESEFEEQAQFTVPNTLSSVPRQYGHLTVVNGFGG